jgi:hypothetical protein
MAPKKQPKSPAAAAAPPPSQQQQQQQQQPPNWPPLTPLLPKTDLSLIESLPDQIITIPSFFTPTLCRTYVNFLSTLPLTTTPGGLNPKKGNAVRVNDRFQIHDANFAERLWRETGLRDLIMGESTDADAAAGEEEEETAEEKEEEEKEKEEKSRENRKKHPNTNFSNEEEEQEKENRPSSLWGGTPLGLNPNIRIYRYTPGQFFAPHYDESNNLSFPISPITSTTSPASSSSSSSSSSTLTKKPTTTIPGRTTWTFLLYLTSPATGCAGGETVFYPDPVILPMKSGGGKKKKGVPPPEPFVVKLETGLALLHKHGEDCMVHEGRAVTAGEKWVIRSDLVVAATAAAAARR